MKKDQKLTLRRKGRSKVRGEAVIGGLVKRTEWPNYPASSYSIMAPINTSTFLL